MRMKNTIMILREIASCYPSLSVVGSRLMDSFRAIAANEQRDDLKLLANAYLGVLKKSQDSNAWMPVAQFHIHRIPTDAPTDNKDKTATPGNAAHRPSQPLSRTEPVRQEPRVESNDSDERRYCPNGQSMYR